MPSFSVPQALLTALLAGAFSTGGVWLAQRAQYRRDQLNDARALRNAKVQRLHAAYAALLGATASWMIVARRAKSAQRRETREDGNEYTPDEGLYLQTISEAEKARAAVALDEGAPDIFAAFDAASMLYYSIVYAVPMDVLTSNDPESMAWAEEFIATIGDLEVKLREMGALAGRRLDELAQPYPRLPRAAPARACRKRPWKRS